MKNVKVILIGVALCATVFANQRIDALGGDSGFWPGDKDNINTFPASINDHGYVQVDGVGEEGGTGDVTAGIVWGDATKWGMSYDEGDGDTWFTLGWGSGDMGITASLISSSDGDDDTEDASGFTFGYGQNFSWGDLGVSLSSVGDATDYSVNWRGDLGFWAFDTSKLGFAMSDDGMDNTSMDLGFDMFTHLDAGGADVMFGLGVDYYTESLGDVTVTSMTLPTATLAVEAAVTDWATLRAFASHAYDFSCTNDGLVVLEEDVDDQSVTFGEMIPVGDYHCSDDTNGPGATDYGFGLGFNWGQATLDMTVGTQLFTNPVGTMTGWDDLDTAAEVTLSYSF